MTRRWVPFAAVALAVVIQLAWAPRWGLWGARPDVVTVVAVSLALLDGPQTGAVAGFAGGLVLDLFSLGPVGVGALARTVACFLAGLVERNIFGRRVLMPMLAVAVGAGVAQLIELGMLILLGRDIPVLYSLLGIIAPSALYNGVVAGLIYPALAAIGRSERGRAPIEQLG